ncbi:MAG: cyclase family protein [Bacteroidota bacterium]
MKVTDLSHTIHNNITVFNEAERPSIEKAATIENDGYAQLRFTMYTHNSTHIDAPAHMVKGGKTLTDFLPESFTGKAFVADVKNAAQRITKEHLAPYEENLKACDFILLDTGWAEKWNTDAYKTGFPVLEPKAAEWLTQFNLKGIGLDTISIDPVDSVEVPNHHIVLGNDMLIIENLTGLDKAGKGVFWFSCFPLKIENADGSPIRAIAMM